MTIMVILTGFTLVAGLYIGEQALYWWVGAFAFDSANGATLVLPWVSMLPVFVSHGVVMTMMITVVTYFHGIIVAMMMITMMCVMAVLLTLLMVPRCDDYYGGNSIEYRNFRGPLPR